jgi:hypothetical protein
LQFIETVIAREHPGFDLTPSSEKTMTQAVEKLDELNSPYRSQQKDKVRSSLVQLLKDGIYFRNRLSLGSAPSSFFDRQTR